MNFAPQVILFDGHGTLTYSTFSTLARYIWLAKKNGFKHSREVIKQCYYELKANYFQFLKQKAQLKQPVIWEQDRQKWFKLEKALFKKIRIKNHYEQLSYQILDNYMSPKNQHIYKDVRPILQYLKQKKYHLGVITNSDSRYRRILRFHGVDQYFDHLFISSEIGYKKPSQKIFNSVSQYFQLPLSQMWYIGDNYELDAKAAAEAGFQKALWLVRNKSKLKTQKFIHSCEIISNLEALKKLI